MNAGVVVAAPIHSAEAGRTATLRLTLERRTKTSLLWILRRLLKISVIS